MFEPDGPFSRSVVSKLRVSGPTFTPDEVAIYKRKKERSNNYFFSWSRSWFLSFFHGR